MSKEVSTAKSGGISLMGLLGIIFIVLKIVKIEPVSDWSWLWVLSPFWIPICLVISIWIIVGIIFLILNRLK